MNIEVEMDVERLPVYLRRGRVMRLLGVDKRVVRSLVEDGVLEEVYLTKGGRAFFRSEQVRRLIEERF